MSTFKNAVPSQLGENYIDLISNQWMLITAGDQTGFNTMTASWGAAGHIWNRDCMFAVVRPQRYTYEFMEKSGYFTCSFFPPEYKKALNYCGSYSGRDVDKCAQTGLTPLFGEYGVYFEQARLVFVCKKVLATDFASDSFVEKSIIGAVYPDNDFHRMYAGEIIECLIKE